MRAHEGTLQNSKTKRTGYIVAAGFGVAALLSPLQAVTASALDLSPVTGVVNKTLQKPLKSLPVVGDTAAQTTDTLLTDTVPGTVEPLTDVVVPKPLDDTLDDTVDAAARPVERIADTTVNPLLDTVTDTTTGLTDGLLPEPLDNVLQTVEEPVNQLSSRLVQPTLRSVPDVAESVADTVDPVTTPVRETLDEPTQTVTDAADPITTPLLNNLRGNTPDRPPFNLLPAVRETPQTQTTAPISRERPDPSPTASATVGTAESSPEQSSPLATIGRFLQNFLPSEAQVALSNFANDRNFAQYVVSLAIFMALLMFIIGMNYAGERGWFRFLTQGNTRIAQLAQTHDISQLMTVSVTVVGVIGITTYLLLAS